MRSKSYYFLLVVLALGLLSGVLFSRTKPNYGLDIKGGIRLTYKMDFSQLTAEQKTDLAGVRSKVITLLINRASGGLGVAEPVVFAKGDDQIIVELPGFSDATKAKEVMGQSARLEYYWARTVNTEINPNRIYTAAREKDQKNPVVNFTRRGSEREIVPGTPEYEAMIKSWDLILSGEDFGAASPTPSGDSTIPHLQFSSSGAPKIKEWTQRHNKAKEMLAAVLDKKVVSIAPIQEGAVISDEGVIQGTYSKEYVAKLCETLNSGALPVDLKEIGTTMVSPSIGQFALAKIITAGMIAFVVIAIFLVSYYAFPGVIALIALLLYVLFTLTALKTAGATFSLAGIAGFILSVGMAVDANILVFERFKEEMAAGKSLRTAIELGFNRALPAIIDSNACTILTSLVLANLGTGPVKGFATTLIIGVLISLFTAFTVTRSLLMFSVGSGLATNPKWFAVERSWFKKFDRKDAEPLTVVEKSKKWFLISAATVVLSIPFFFFGGFKLNVEFRGGYESVYSQGTTSFDSNLITKNLEIGGFKGGNATLATDGTGKQLVYIDVPVTPALKDAANDPARQKLIAAAAGIPDAVPSEFTSMSATLQAETIRNAAIGVVLSSGLVIFYLALRFGIGFGGFAPGMRFGISAIGALLHDILVVFGLAAVFGFIFHWEVSALFLTAMLTIIGFSVHDTIVIFDRIRENLRRPHGGETFGHLVDRSITRSFTRSINTSMTVIVTLFILVFFGTPTPELKFFVVAMMCGIISGTYSSIYNASPILYLWDKMAAAKSGSHATLVGMANVENDRTRIVSTAIGETPQVESTKSGRSYGQVRRRANSSQEKPGWEEID